LVDTRTGEIKEFPVDETLPKHWKGLPELGAIVKVIHTRKLPGSAKRKSKSKWKVVGLEEGKPGRMMLEAMPQ